MKAMIFLGLGKLHIATDICRDKFIIMIYDVRMLC